MLTPRTRFVCAYKLTWLYSVWYLIDVIDSAFFPFNSTTAESLTNHNEAELQRRCRERQQEIDHMQQVLETKIQLLQEVRPFTPSAGWNWRAHTLRFPNELTVSTRVYFQEAQLARSEAERMASLAGSHSHASLLSLDIPMEDIPEDERPPSILSLSNTNKDRCKTLRNPLNQHWYQTNQIHLHVSLTISLSVFRLIEELTKELCSKEALITELSGEKTTLTLRVGELEGQVQELSSSLLQKDKDVEVDTHFVHVLNDT